MGKIGIFGGSFNPPHNGHILAAEELARRLELDKIYLVPAATPPHKQLPPGSPDGPARLHLLQLATAGHPKLEACDLELRRGGVSYTADTVRQLRKQHPADRLYLLVGPDMFLTLDAWRAPVMITSQCTIVLVQREKPDEDLQRRLDEQRENLYRTYAAQIVTVENDYLPISSTLVRRMLTFGCGEAYLAPAVYQAICNARAYGLAKSLRGLPLDALREAAINLLNTRRVAHVLGCSETAAKLARRYGASERDAARAGLLHDITKALPPDAQLRLCQKYDILITDFERANPKLLHAKTGAAVARHIFGENDAICDAICWHTTGKAEMTLLEKILYLADYMEPNRRFPGVELLREQVEQDLDQALYTALEMSVQSIEEKGALLDENSRQARDYMQRQLEKK